MIAKRIILFIYFTLVVAVFSNTIKEIELNVGVADIFFGILFPCFAYWLIHMWLIKSDNETKGSWVYWVNWLFYFLCFISGVAVLVKIYLVPSLASLLYMSLPLIQGFFFLISVVIMAHIAVYAKSLK